MERRKSNTDLTVGGSYGGRRGADLGRLLAALGQIDDAAAALARPGREADRGVESAVAHRPVGAEVDDGLILFKKKTKNQIESIGSRPQSSQDKGKPFSYFFPDISLGSLPLIATGKSTDYPPPNPRG